MTETAADHRTPTAADLDRMTRDLQSAVWMLAFAGDVGLDRARRVRHAAHLLAAAADQLFMDAAGGAVTAAAPGLPGLVSALVTLGRLDPVDRGRLAPDVMTLARTVLRRERGRAMAETGLSITELAREYGISAGAVRAALGDARGAGPAPGIGPGVGPGIGPDGSAESRRAAPEKSGSEPMCPPGAIRDAP